MGTIRFNLYINSFWLLEFTPKIEVSVQKRFCTFSITPSHTAWVLGPVLLWPRLPNCKESESFLPGGSNPRHPASKKGKCPLAQACTDRAAQQADWGLNLEKHSHIRIRQRYQGRSQRRNSWQDKRTRRKCRESQRPKEGKGSERRGLHDSQGGTWRSFRCQGVRSKGRTAISVEGSGKIQIKRGSVEDGRYIQARWV